VPSSSIAATPRRHLLDEDPLFWLLARTPAAAITTTAATTTTALHMQKFQTPFQIFQSSRRRSDCHISSTQGKLHNSRHHHVDDKNNQETEIPSIRKELGKITGISLTALRTSLRATTGFSLTALRTALRTLTGVSITGVVKTLVGLLPPWFRYFLQPFLILYYVPLLVLKGMVGSTSTSKREASEEHDKLVNYWKDAIMLAETRSASWPLHVKADGTLKYDLDDDKMNDVIVEAIEMKHVDEKEEKNF
jgi:hypothetical protein